MKGRSDEEKPRVKAGKEKNILLDRRAVFRARARQGITLERGRKMTERKKKRRSSS